MNNMNDVFISKANAGDIIVIPSDTLSVGTVYKEVKEISCPTDPAQNPKYRISETKWVDESSVLDCFTPYPVGEVVELNCRKATIKEIDYSEAVYVTEEGFNIPLNEHWLWRPISETSSVM